MKRNPLVPFIVIAIFGIVLIVTFSIIGLNHTKELANGADKGTQVETAAANPDDIYKQNCSACHGQNFEGVVGPSLKGVGKELTVDQIKETITKGKSGDIGTMPAFGGTIPDDQIAKLAQWVSEIK
jgi:cytochrome c550